VGLTSAFGTVPGETGSNPVAAPSSSTICGNGRIEALEECDDGANNGKSSSNCSTICRCIGSKQFVAIAGSNPGGTGAAQCVP
jgi:hypothetical protein